MAVLVRAHERKRVVLVADGEIGVLLDVASTLKKAGFEVRTAPDRSAVLEAGRNREPIDLAIIDIAMLDAAPDLLEQLHQAQPGVRLLLSSSRDASEVRWVPEYPSGPHRGRLRKPFRRAQLLGRVLEALSNPSAIQE
jgi:DNA-binding NtrC family response regulator